MLLTGDNRFQPSTPAAVPTREMTRKRESVASEDAVDKPVYLVVEHEVEDPSSHSIVIVGTTTPPVMVPLRHAKRGMSFAAVDSRWIVGVGGDYHRRHFTIYDLTTSTESGGPWLFSNKVNPILIPHRDMLYILSSRPRIDRGADCLPWFEMIIFRNGRVPQPGGSASHNLPPPPVFPYCINPVEYLDPPGVRVVAYALVGSRILLSVSYTVSDSVRQQLRMQIPSEEPPEEKGTCAFDMDGREWEMVHHKNLPFLGEAVPLGGHLFAATRSSDGFVSVYQIEILTVGDSRENTELRVLELPLLGRRIVPGQLLRGSGEGRFSTFDVRFKQDPTDNGVRIVHRTYSVTVVDTDGGTTDQTTNAPVSVAVKRRRRRIHKIVDPAHRLACLTPLVAALTL